MEHIELLGKIVTLLPLTDEHLLPLYEAAKPKKIWEWSATKILSFEDAENFIKDGIEARKNGLHYPFVVIENKTNQIIGSTSLRSIQFSNRSLEIGSTWYHPTHWRTAVNSECKLLLLQHAFETWSMNRVEFRTDERNIRSQTAIKRLGAVPEGILRKDKVLLDGSSRNTAVFSILVEEWPDVKNRLEVFLAR